MPTLQKSSLLKDLSRLTPDGREDLRQILIAIMTSIPAEKIPPTWLVLHRWLGDLSSKGDQNALLDVHPHDSPDSTFLLGKSDGPKAL
jgi:hypothetical protein